MFGSEENCSVNIGKLVCTFGYIKFTLVVLNQKIGNIPQWRRLTGEKKRTKKKLELAVKFYL